MSKQGEKVWDYMNSKNMTADDVVAYVGDRNTAIEFGWIIAHRKFREAIRKRNLQAAKRNAKLPQPISAKTLEFLCRELKDHSVASQLDEYVDEIKKSHESLTARIKL